MVSKSACEPATTVANSRHRVIAEAISSTLKATSSRHTDDALGTVRIGSDEYEADRQYFANNPDEVFRMRPKLQHEFSKCPSVEFVLIANIDAVASDRDDANPRLIVLPVKGRIPVAASGAASLEKTWRKVLRQNPHFREHAWIRTFRAALAGRRSRQVPAWLGPQGVRGRAKPVQAAKSGEA